MHARVSTLVHYIGTIIYRVDPKSAQYLTQL